METLHHVHADDVAQMFMKAIQHKNQVLGQSFHAVSDHSITLYGYAHCYMSFFIRKRIFNFCHGINGVLMSTDKMNFFKIHHKIMYFFQEAFFKF